MVPFVGDWTPPGNGDALVARPQHTGDGPIRSAEGTPTLYPRGEVPGPPYTELGVVYGTTPLAGTQSLDARRDEALADLKSAAAALKANAVIDVYCDGRNPPDWQGNHVGQKCTGHAVVFK